MTQAILAAHSYSTRAVEVLIEAFRSLRQHRLDRKVIRDTEKELHRLTDKELSDIGLCRGDIYYVARSNDNMKGWV